MKLSNRARRIVIGIALVLLTMLLVALGFFLWLAHRVGQYNTPLAAAAGRGDLETVKSLLAKGADINEQPRGMLGMTPLLQAIGTGYTTGKTNVVFYLLERGANPNLKDHAGSPALYFAVAQGDFATNLVKALIAHGADVNFRTEHGDSLLGIALHNGHPAVASLLQDAGAKP